jgi:hypothetical protein
VLLLVVRCDQVVAACATVCDALDLKTRAPHASRPRKGPVGPSLGLWLELERAVRRAPLGWRLVGPWFLS